MRLESLLRHTAVLRAHGELDHDVQVVTRDSREVRGDALFVAIRGAHVDGHDLTAGLTCAGVVAEHEVPVPPGVPLVVVPNTRRALAELAAAVADWPSRHVPVIGVTGTNGKTTITTLVEEALRHGGKRAGRIGTTGIVIDGAPQPGSLTTPEAPVLQGLLAKMVGFDAVAMEVSSIGLDQHRVDGIDFHTAVFTNLTLDHLDYHGSLDAYAAAKARLFEELLRPEGGAPRALMWGDDSAWQRMAAPTDRWLYGFGGVCDLRILRFRTVSGLAHLEVATPVGPGSIRSPLLGRHNALNLTAALGCLITLGVPASRGASWLSAVDGVRGRLQQVDNDDDLLVLVDYAHSPDALEAALRAAREAVSGQVWVVFGCGGDRDATKRPVMGGIAARLADRVVVTSDNPRSEDPRRIVDAILSGMDLAPEAVELDRRVAIARAIRSASPGDAVLIAGKGHETTQQVGDAFLPFDDVVVAREAVEAR